MLGLGQGHHRTTDQGTGKHGEPQALQHGLVVCQQQQWAPGGGFQRCAVLDDHPTNEAPDQPVVEIGDWPVLLAEPLAPELLDEGQVHLDRPGLLDQDVILCLGHGGGNPCVGQPFG